MPEIMDTNVGDTIEIKVTEEEKSFMKYDPDEKMITISVGDL